MVISPLLFLCFLIPLVSSSSDTCPNQTAVLDRACEEQHGQFWRGVVRNDNSIMCMSMFIGNATKCTSYSEAKEICRQHGQGALLAPVANEREQKILNEFIYSARDGNSPYINNPDAFHLYGVYLGAQKVGDLMAKGANAEYVWDYDGKKVEGYRNFRVNEPNNPLHTYVDLPQHYEHCIAATATNELGVWYDQSCELQCRGSTTFAGVACAKPLINKEDDHEQANYDHNDHHNHDNDAHNNHQNNNDYFYIFYDDHNNPAANYYYNQAPHNHDDHHNNDNNPANHHDRQ